MNQQTTTTLFNILLVEDNQSDAVLTQIALTDAQIPHKLQVVKNVDDGLNVMYQSNQLNNHTIVPDFVLLDLRLPEREGTDFLEIIKKEERFNHVPIIVLTTSDSPNDRKRCQSLSADGYIIKAVDLDQFVSNIKGIWAILKKFGVN